MSSVAVRLSRLEAGSRSLSPVAKVWLGMPVSDVERSSLGVDADFDSNPDVSRMSLEYRKSLGI